MPAQAAEAPGALVLDDSQPRQPAWPAITLLADAGHAQTLDDVLRQTARFTRPATGCSTSTPRRSSASMPTW